MKRGPTSLRGRTIQGNPRRAARKCHCSCAETQENSCWSFAHVDGQGLTTTLASQLIRPGRGRKRQKRQKSQKPRPDPGSGAPAGGFWDSGGGWDLKAGDQGSRCNPTICQSHPCPAGCTPHRHGLGVWFTESMVFTQGPGRKTFRQLRMQPWMQPALPRRPKAGSRGRETQQCATVSLQEPGSDSDVACLDTNHRGRGLALSGTTRPTAHKDAVLAWQAGGRHGGAQARIQNTCSARTGICAE